jgi:hypothetical protein
MKDLQAAIRHLKQYEQGRLSGREFADCVIAALEDIDRRLVALEGRQPAPGTVRAGLVRAEEASRS